MSKSALAQTGYIYKLPERHIVIENVGLTLNLDISKLKPRPFINMSVGNKCDNGCNEEMRKCAVKLNANLGLDDGQRMLAEQDKIPVEFRGFDIPLPGTLLCDPSSGLYVMCLLWERNNDQFVWGWGCYWYSVCRYSNSRLRFACSGA